MSETCQLLQDLVQKEQLSDDDPDECRLIDLFLEDLARQPWFHDPFTGEAGRVTGGTERIAREAVRNLVDSLRRKSERRGGDLPFEKEIQSLCRRWTEAVFFVPDLIERIYAPHEGSPDPLVQEGVKVHSEWIHHAVQGLAYRHAASFRHLVLDAQGLADELWSLVMEELVRCMTDNHARVWFLKEKRCLAFPTEKMRGRRLGITLRVALSSRGDRLATFRTDHELFLWEIRDQVLSQSIDLRSLPQEPFPIAKTEYPLAMVFSTNAKRIALEYVQGIWIVSENGELERGFRKDQREAFLKDFGMRRLPRRESWLARAAIQKTLLDEKKSITDYVQKVYDWTCLPKGDLLCTASEMDRKLPDWIRQAGFEKAVYHIAKKRLVDLIRKHSHTTAATESSPAILVKQIELDPDVLDRLGEEDASTWQDDHDFNKILAALQNDTLSYKDRVISCDRLLILKAEGMTNEEIGLRLHVPRGTVDYLWNQCKSLVIRKFGTI